MNIDKVEMLLRDVYHISTHYEKMGKLSGENFNIFQILSLESSEVRMHSALLAELLNSKGSHGQDDLFLDLFVKQFGIVDFDTKSAIAEVEKYIGFINHDYSQGGKIDILLTDMDGKHIIIENKIYAGDQKNQLLRYYNYDVRAHLYYLNLDGAAPTDFSTDGALDSDKYTIISYSYNIIEWLEKCKKEAVSLPIIRETIGQYIWLLKHLTNQTQISKMKDEIQNLLAKNPDYIDSIELCTQVVQSMVFETKTKFNDLFDEIFPEIKIQLSNGLKILIHWGEDGDGIFFGYQLTKQDENYGNSDIAREYGSILKEIYSNMYSTEWNFGWFTPKPFQRRQKFEHLDKKEIFKMSNDSLYLRNFIESLINQEKIITEQFLKRIDG